MIGAHQGRTVRLRVSQGCQVEPGRPTLTALPPQAPHKSTTTFSAYGCLHWSVGRDGRLLYAGIPEVAKKHISGDFTPLLVLKLGGSERCMPRDWPRRRN